MYPFLILLLHPSPCARKKPPSTQPDARWPPGTHRGLFQAVEVDVQVGIDAIGGTRQCDTMDQEHK